MKTNSLQEKSLEEALRDLYLTLKAQEKKETYDDKRIKTEKEKLSKFNSFIIIEYIKSSINILVDRKVKEQLESFFSNFNSFDINNNKESICVSEVIDNKKKESHSKEKEIKKAGLLTDKDYNSNSDDYEDLLRKHESDIRNHIKIQHQYRIYSENLKNKIEELEKSIIDHKKTIVILQEKLDKSSKSNIFADKKEKEINYLNSEIQGLKVVLNSFQNQNSKILELETKLRMQKMKYDRRIKQTEEKFMNEINILNKKIFLYENTNNFSEIKKRNKNKDLSNLLEEDESFSREIGDFTNTSARGNNKMTNLDRNKYSSLQDKNHESNLEKKVEIYKQLIERKLENFSYKNRIKKIQTYTSATDTNNLSKDVTNHTMDRNNEMNVLDSNPNKESIANLFKRGSTLNKNEINELSDDDDYEKNTYKRNLKKADQKKSKISEAIKFKTYREEVNSCKENENTNSNSNENNEKLHIHQYEIRSLKEARLNKDYYRKNYKLKKTDNPRHHRSQSMNTLI